MRDAIGCVGVAIFIGAAWSPFIAILIGANLSGVCAASMAAIIFAWLLMASVWP